MHKGVWELTAYKVILNEDQETSKVNRFHSHYLGRHRKQMLLISYLNAYVCVVHVVVDAPANHLSPQKQALSQVHYRAGNL